MALGFASDPSPTRPCSSLIVARAFTVVLLATALPASRRRWVRKHPRVSAAGFLYETREEMIRARRRELHTLIWTPKVRAEPLPIIMVRTPYGIDVYKDGSFMAWYRELAEDGYIFVYQDIRGRHGSEGTFVMNAPGLAESTDAYDTVDWLVKNVPGNNGKVGVRGVSYPGWLAGMAGVNPHPAVRAISPQAPMTDTWLGDDFFHQGAFRQKFGLEYPWSMESEMVQAGPLKQDRFDKYDWYLQFLSLGDLERATGAIKIPSWRDFRAHPTYDAYWKSKAMTTWLTEPTVPALMVGGFWDQEDLFGPIRAYRVIEQKDVKKQSFFVAGPWYHGQWGIPGADSIGNISFGMSAADWFRQNVQRPWFAYYLKGKGTGVFPEAWVFESGGNTWRTFDTWPPKKATPRALYLRSGGRLSFDAPTTDEGADGYVSDPRYPVPYMPRPVDDSRWHQWMTEDQRFVHNRPDVLSWETPVLTEDVVIAGNIAAKLLASTTGTDADWVVKLIDVYPDDPALGRMGGYQLMVAGDILRGRYYKSFEKPEAIATNTVTPFTVDLHQQLYRFKKGHRIMVQVQSTWFPLYDRNPQTFVPSLFDAKASDFKAQTHRVWHSPKFPSRIEVTTLVP
jgi:putative CocE/NonD family hydrolase